MAPAIHKDSSIDTSTYDPPNYIAPSQTKAQLDYAELAVIDLSKTDTAKGRAELATQVCNAMTTQGFFYVINHGYTEVQTERIFGIANLTFDGVTSEEKLVYTGNTAELGTYQGYKDRQYWLIEPGVYDQIEHYNLHRNVLKDKHPIPLRPYLSEIAAFARHNHFNIVHPILRLLALGLEMPEDTLVDQHVFDAPGETSEDEETKTKNVWLKGHTDFGSVTVLWSQPVGGLQILSSDGKWRWIRHIDNALVINAGDALEFLSGGFYKPTIHRVIQPPADQRNCCRLGVFYFCGPDRDVKLIPHESSPLLKRLGVRRLCDDKDAPTMDEWRKGRTISYGRVELTMKETGVEEEIIHGLVVKHYN